MISLSTAKSEDEDRPAVSALLVMAVFAAHMIVGVVLYRGRAISTWAISDSDFVVFALPYILATVGYFYAFRLMPWLHRRRSTKVMASFTASCFSSWAYMLIALNTYGT